MGASSWVYIVPYDSDFAAALARLQQQVFESGEYYGGREKRRPKTLAELRKRSGEGGTHSILDMKHVGPTPDIAGDENLWQPPNTDERGVIDMKRFEPEAHQRWLDRVNATLFSVRELHPDDLVRLFGTTKPTRAQAEAREYELLEMRERGLGTIVVLYEGDVPRELMFVGFSGD